MPSTAATTKPDKTATKKRAVKPQAEAPRNAFAACELAIKDFDASDLYTRYRCTIKFRDRIMGGTPKDSELIAAWVKARTGFDDETTRQQIEEAKNTLSSDKVDEMTEKQAEKSWCGFPQDDRGLYIRSRQVKALFKECASLLRITKTKVGSKQILQHGFEIKGAVKDDRVHLDREEPDGTDESPIHVLTAQGPRTAIKRADYVTEATITFDIWVLRTAPQEKRHIGERECRLMLAHAQENGLGASRSQGYGKFDVINFQRLDEPRKED